MLLYASLDVLLRKLYTTYSSRYPSFRYITFIHSQNLTMHIPRALTTAAAAAPRFAVYYDQWHPSSITKAQTAGITHVITAFAASTLFNVDPPQTYAPFVDVATLRSLFDDGTKMCVAIGGWGDTAGFSVGQKDDASRKTFAKGVASTLENLGYDCVGVYRRSFLYHAVMLRNDNRYRLGVPWW